MKLLIFSLDIYRIININAINSSLSNMKYLRNIAIYRLNMKVIRINIRKTCSESYSQLLARNKINLIRDLGSTTLDWG